MNQWHFHSPWMFLLLLLVPVVGYFMFAGRRRARLKFSYVGLVEKVGWSARVKMRPLLVFMRLGAMVLLIIALARPQQGVSETRVTTHGALLELVVDHSGSMQRPMAYAGNRQMSRLDVVKDVLRDFVRGGDGFGGRPNDLLGLIAFARYADTLCPLVHAHDALLGYLDSLTYAVEDENSTSVGAGIALAAARLERAQQEIAERNARLTGGDISEIPPGEGEFNVESMAIVLLTDGRDEGPITYTPMQAAQFAHEAGIKIYTIGIGSGGGGPFAAEYALDEPLLRRIAEYTGGLYARAEDAESLRAIVEAIDRQEKSKIDVVEYSRYDEKFYPFALTGLGILLLEILLSCTVFRKLP
ncbi:MAG: VWA domain-containing protein [Sedimentisphaerales bacterium]|nr:VWA domain-containing protein [Sedimentisphaerales bacterium]